MDYYEEELEIVYGEDPPADPVSFEDGFDITRNNKGYLDLDYWASITGLTVDEIIERANGTLMWRNPRQAEMGADFVLGWVTREQILRGNRIRKLKHARRLLKNHKEMREVVKLLEENLPEEVSGEDIHVNLGATWILNIENFISDFIGDLLDMRLAPEVTYDSYRGKWEISCREEPNYVLNYLTYGTLDMSCIRILENKLNARPVKVYDQVYNYTTGKNESVLNRAKSLAAQEKGKLVDVKFQDYCHGNKENEDRLQAAYMTQYGYGLCEFDGDYLKLADASQTISLYKHQKRAVAHVMACHNVLLAHNVGSGKTYEYACGIHELIRLGICKKAVIAVPNNTLEATARAYQDLFPADPVMVCRPRKEFFLPNREDTLRKIKEMETGVVFFAYSSFDMITMTKRYAFAKKDAALHECERRAKTAPTHGKKAKLETMLKRMQKTTADYKENFKDTECACFDELGFDILVVDEAHNYKNITLNYSADNIVGMHNKGSRKADGMLEKVRFIQERDGRVIFATGTPITNSMADLYVLQYYLQPEELRMCDIYHFNDWIKTFCEEEFSFEVDVDSKNGRFTTRFSKFHNLPELMSMFSEVCDFYQSDAGELGLPMFSGYRDIVVKKSPEQKAYINELAKRTEAIRNREVSRREDNLLKITVQGRQAALDIRIVDPTQRYVPVKGKVHVCALQMLQLYHSHPDKCQIAFSDISTPKEGFNVYDALKEELISLGVPENEIAFVHDAVTESQRTILEQRFNNGTLRILIGSTAKLGTGSNVQERLIAVHHLDVPWRPADMVQREGRIIRQGNQCPEVFIYRYITEASFDAYTYQILENKQKFIAQFLSGSLSAVHREESDCADTILSYAEIKALAIGNPLIKERVELANQLEHARINQRQKRKELLSLEDLAERLPSMIAKRQRLIANVQSDMDHYAESKEIIRKEERQEFGEELLLALQYNILGEKPRLFSDYQGFQVILPAHMEAEKPYVILMRKGSNQYHISMDGDKALGVCQRLDRYLDNLGKVLNRHRDKLREMMQQKKQTEQDLDAGNCYDEEVAELAARLQEIDEILMEDPVA